MLVLSIFAVAIPFVITTSFDQYREIWKHPFGAVVLGFVEYLCLIVSLFMLLKIFINASREVENELVF